MFESLVRDKVASYTWAMSDKQILISFPYQDHEIAARWWVENRTALVEPRKLIAEFYHATNIAIGYAHWFDQYAMFRWPAKWIAETGLECVEQLRDLARAEERPDRRLQLLSESAGQMLDSFRIGWPGDEVEIRRFRGAARRIVDILEELEEEVLTTVFSAVGFA